MKNRMPSFLALLGLAAAAGYQNRDALRQMMSGPGTTGQSGASGSPDHVPNFRQQGWLETIVDRAKHSMGSGSPLAAGLGELATRFSRTGSGALAESWVGSGPNHPVSAEQVRVAAGPEVIEELVRQTGLTEAALLDRLSRSLPELVDHSTPEGRLPPEDTEERIQPSSS